MTDHITTQSAVVATLPDGTQIAVDQLPTGELVQVVKLYDATNDSTNAAIVTAAGALKVDGSAVTQPISGTVTITDGSGPVTVDGTVAVSNFPATQPVSAAALPLPAGAATDASLATLDADLKAEIGTVSGTPSAYTVLDRLNQIGLKIDNHAKIGATEATLKKLLAALSKPVAPTYSTLLHR